MQSGLLMAMAAAEKRGTLVAGDEGFECAFKAGALWVGTRIHASAGPGGRLQAAGAGVTRLRRALEGSNTFRIGRCMSRQPSVEIGLRQDGGDAEVGSGLDVGGGGPAWRLFLLALLRGRGGVVRLRRPVLGAEPSDHLPAGSACGRLRRRRASLGVVVARARRGGRG